MRRLFFVVLGVIIALWIVLPQFVFVIDERDQAIITQFGAYVRTITTPGFHVKVPFVHTLQRLDKRVLATDAAPAEYLTLDKKRLVVDYVTRWRINDPLAFFKTVATLEGVRARIEDIVFSEPVVNSPHRTLRRSPPRCASQLWRRSPGGAGLARRISASS